LNKRIWNRKYN